jgi:hypothetical protein
MNKLVPKRLDVENETRKLLKQIGEILEFDTSDFSPEEYLLSSMQKMLNSFRNLELRKKTILEKLEAIEADKRLTPNQKINALQGLKHELTTLLKAKIAPEKPTKSAKIAPKKATKSAKKVTKEPKKSVKAAKEVEAVTDKPIQANLFAGLFD